MQRDAVGIPIAAPIINRAAVEIDVLDAWIILSSKERLTDIAPNWCPVNRVASPDNRIDKLVQTG
jgi:hypothetical protein